MSSCNWDKYKGAREAKAMFQHNDKDERLKNNHQNPDIDKTRTDLNLNFTGRSYEEECEAYDARIAETQKNATRKLRKDAVTCIGLNIKLPPDLTYADYETQCAWAKDCYEMVKKVVGEENIISATADFDEVHEFVDPETGEKKLSRPEVDVRFVPFFEGKLQGSALASRKNMRAMNTNLENMTQKKYHCKFMTGEQAKNESTDELKAKSRVAELEQRVKELEEQIKTSEDDLRVARSELEQAKKELKTLQEQNKTLQGENDRLRHFNASTAKKTGNIEHINEQAEDIRRKRSAQADAALSQGES